MTDRMTSPPEDASTGDEQVNESMITGEREAAATDDVVTDASGTEGGAAAAVAQVEDADVVLDADDAADDADADGADDAEVPADEAEGDATEADEAEMDETGEAEDDGDGDTGRTRPSASRRSLLEREGEVAADFLETLLDIADLDGDIDLGIDGDRATVAIVDSEDGRVPRRLVGPDGKVLDALQELTRLAVQASTGERSRLMLDVAGHRAARRAELVELAREAIEEVRSSGKEVAMAPMTAFERKVVHDEVLAAGLGSESSGVEPRRYVVVLPA